MNNLDNTPTEESEEQQYFTFPDTTQQQPRFTLFDPESVPNLNTHPCDPALEED